MCVAFAASPAPAQRFSPSSSFHASSDSHRPALVTVDLAASNPPDGEQMVIGWMSSILVGFAAWRAFDSPNGQHPKVRDGWGYTPKALTAMGIGSYVGATAGVWLSGRRRGASGTLLGTAIGAALPTIPVFLMRDDPLLPLMIVIAWAPAQGVLAYTGYKVSVKNMTLVAADIAVQRRADPKRPTNVILADDIATTSATNVYDVVARLHPEWLARETRALTSRNQGGERAYLIAYFEGARYGTVDALRTLAVAGVQQITYYDPAAATARYGTGHSAGVIAVNMTRQ